MVRKAGPTARQWRTAPPTTTAQPADPFEVHGVVEGRAEVACVRDPSSALDVMVAWLQRDSDAALTWQLRQDWPTPVTAIGRLPAGPAGTGGETRRSAHLFPLRPSVSQYGSLASYCGTELALPDIEWLAAGAGMPCESCLALHLAEHGASDRSQEH